MKHEALWQLGAELMHEFRLGDGPADVVYSNYVSNRRFLGATDRRYLSNIFFHALRHLRRYDEAIVTAFDHMVLAEARYSTGFPLTDDMGARAWHRRLPGEREGQQPDQRFFDRSVDTLRLGLAGLETEKEDKVEQVAAELIRCWPQLREKQAPKQATIERLVSRTFELAKQYKEPSKELHAARRFSQPTWLWGLLRDGLTDEEADKLGESLNQEANPMIRVNTLKANRDEVIAALEREAIKHRPSPLLPGAIRLYNRMPNHKLPKWDEGWFEIQDGGSQLTAHYAAPEPGWRIADACAGGGGKSLALAAIMKNKGVIYAFDTDARRLAPLAARAKRAGVTIINTKFTVSETGAIPVVRELDGLDMVVVDAPCSGTGTMRRSPDIRWRLSPNALEDYRAKQREILKDWSLCVKEGGYLVYITCSLLEVENAAQTQWFLENNPNFEPAPPENFLTDLADDGSLRLRPDTHGCDGFFAMRWRKTGPTPKKPRLTK